MVIFQNVRKKGTNDVNSAEPTQLYKKLLSLVLTLVFLVGCLPAALALDMNVDAGFYFKQSTSKTCTLASAAMMIRRYAYFNALDGWTDVTENSIRSTAWYNGLSHDFTYKEMQVGYDTLPSNQTEKINRLIELLQQHPEGIVLYDRTRPHAVLLTDYTNGVFYCADPARNVSAGRIPLTSTTVSVARASCYWYMVNENDVTAAQADGLRLEGMSYPVNVKTGNGVSLTGAVSSASGTTLSEVEILILDAADQEIQRASVQMQAESWSFCELDSAIRFGELAPGSYTYLVLVTDSAGQTLCFTSEFTVSSGAEQVEDYWSVYDTGSTTLLLPEEETLQTQSEEQPDGTAGKGWLHRMIFG